MEGRTRKRAAERMYLTSTLEFYPTLSSAGASPTQGSKLARRTDFTTPGVSSSSPFQADGSKQDDVCAAPLSALTVEASFGTLEAALFAVFQREEVLADAAAWSTVQGLVSVAIHPVDGR